MKRSKWAVGLAPFVVAFTLCGLLFTTTAAHAVGPNDGQINSTFLANYTSVGGRVYAAVEQPNGQIVLGGDFTKKIARLNADGSRDTSFSAAIGSGFNGDVVDLAVQQDDSIIVSGGFTSFNGMTVGPVVRLTTEGLLDGTFSANARAAIGNSVNGSNMITVRSLAVVADGVYVGGAFTGGNLGNSYMVKLDNTGTPSQLLNHFNGAVLSILPRSDGTVLVGGEFSSYVTMLNSSGFVASSFAVSLGAPNGPVNALAQDITGNVYLGGDFTSIAGIPAGKLAKADSAGVRQAFLVTGAPNAGFDGPVTSIAVQQDGRVFASGFFNTLNGAQQDFGVELSTAGVIDSTFNANLGTGFSGVVESSITLSTGNILAVGFFGRVNTVTSPSVAMLIATPTYTVRYNANGGTGTVPQNQTFLTTTTIAAGTSLSRPGYTFQRWNSAQQAGSGTPYSAGATYNTQADLTAWAVWSGLPYTVTYSTGTGGSSVSQGSYNTGSPFTLAAAPTRPGYTFDNWTVTNSDNSTQVVNAGSSYTPVGYGNITAAANWTARSYNVTYDTGSGGSTVAQGSYTTGSALSLPAAPTRAGYTFDNWTVTDTDNSTHTVNAGSSYNPVAFGNISAVANWTAAAPVPTPSPTPTTSSPAESGLAYTGLGTALILFPTTLFAAGLLLMALSRNPRRK